MNTRNTWLNLSNCFFHTHLSVTFKLMAWLSFVFLRKQRLSVQARPSPELRLAPRPQFVRPSKAGGPVPFVPQTGPKEALRPESKPKKKTKLQNKDNKNIRRSPVSRAIRAANVTSRGAFSTVGGHKECKWSGPARIFNIWREELGPFRFSFFGRSAG